MPRLCNKITWYQETLGLVHWPKKKKQQDYARVNETYIYNKIYYVCYLYIGFGLFIFVLILAFCEKGV